MTHKPRSVLLEVCVASLEGALAAVDGGADRLELNLALERGGLTPSAGLLRQVRERVRVPIVAMIRPRPGGFQYSADEQSCMLRDAELLLDAGADGVAAGAILPDRTVNGEFWSELVRRAAGRQTVFHRAFDLVADPARTLESLVEAGTTRVLTSGGAPTARAGADAIARLVERARGRIEILPAAGISAENIAELVRRTGCDQVHGSFGATRTDPAGPVAGADYRVTCRDRVAAARATLDALARATR